MRRSKIADLLLGDPLGRREREAEACRVAKRREGRDPLRPGLPGRKRHLDLGDDAVDAIGVQHLQDVAAVELDRCAAPLRR